VKEVSRQLGVRYVLEGSIRRAGNRVRITGQLIEAATGAHIWASVTTVISPTSLSFRMRSPTAWSGCYSIGTAIPKDLNIRATFFSNSVAVNGLVYSPRPHRSARR
jgi:hypothetical protein